MPNMVFRRQRQRKGKERSPFKGEFFGRKDMGPLKKNLLIPKELANKLKRKVRMGRAELKSVYLVTVRPMSLLGKKPSMEKMIASEIFTYESNTEYFIT